MQIWNPCIRYEFMSTNQFWCIGYTCKSVLNTLGRVIEQLARCLAKQAKSSSWGQSTTVIKANSKVLKCLRNIWWHETVSPLHMSLWHKITPIASPTRYGIRPVPNRNKSETTSLVSQALPSFPLVAICSISNDKLAGSLGTRLFIQYSMNQNPACLWSQLRSNLQAIFCCGGYAYHV